MSPEHANLFNVVGRTAKNRSEPVPACSTEPGRSNDTVWTGYQSRRSPTSPRQSLPARRWRPLCGCGWVAA